MNVTAFKLKCHATANRTQLHAIENSIFYKTTTFESIQRATGNRNCNRIEHISQTDDVISLLSCIYYKRKSAILHENQHMNIFW